MILSPASTAELVRSNQKDRYYSSHLGTLTADIIDPYIPRKYWLRWQREIQLVGELMYYGLTTIRGNQTLGEEYTNTVQVVTSPVTKAYSVPGITRRVLSICLQVFGRYMIERSLYLLQDMVAKRRLPFTLDHTHYRLLEGLVTGAADIVASVNQLHLGLFYLVGLYHNIGKRVAGIQYLVVRYQQMATPTNPYKLLGILLLLQVLYKLLMGVARGCGLLNRDSVNSNSYGNTSSVPFVGEQLSRSLKCALCLEACTVPTATPCGHVMCWKCSAEWIREKGECPICRTALEPRQLTPLQYYEAR